MKRVLCLVALLAAACSNPLNQPMPADLKSAGDDKAFHAAVEKLPQDQRDLLVGYVARAALAEAFSAGTVKGNAKTIGEAIDDQRKFIAETKAKEAEQKALAEKVAAERAAATKAMDDVLTVALTGKSVRPKDIHAGRYRDAIAITIAFKNKSAKELTGVKGRLVFKDIFGDTIKSSGLKVDDPIAAGATFVWEGTSDINEFIREDTRLAQTPQDKLRVVWEPITYLFKDGSTLTAPDGP